MKEQRAKQIADYAVTISVLFYVVACFFPTGVSFGADPAKGGRGIVCLLLGWLGVYGEYTLLLGGWAQVVEDKLQFFLTSFLSAPAILGAWLSNFIYFWAMVNLFRERKAKHSLILCAIAFASALAFLVIYFPFRLHRFPQLGSWFWLSSYMLALIGSIAFWLSRQCKGEQPAVASISETEQPEHVQSSFVAEQEKDEEPLIATMQNTWKETWKERKKDKWLMASLVFFGLACFCPMVAHNYTEYGAPGFFCFFVGWLGILNSFNVIFIWLTNFFYCASLWIAFHKPTSSPGPVVLALLTFLVTVILLIAQFITSRDHNYHDEVFHIGYYFWMVSTFSVMISTMRRWWNTK